MFTWPTLRPSKHFTIETLNLISEMKKLIILLLFACGFLSMLQANNGCNQRLTPEEFRARQQAYITEKAGLTEEEAAKFFPIYFELQDRKQQLKQEGWELFRKGKDGNISEAEYEELLDAYYDNRIATERLEKTYFKKFQEILPNKKIYQVMSAEIHFYRGIVKGMHPKGKEKP